MPVSMNNNRFQTIQTQKVSIPSPKSENEEKSSMSTGTKVAIGAGLAALAAVGIYLVTKGRGGSKEISVDAFKKAGNKFIKGKAITKSGKEFTGNITHKTKDGKTIVMKYENGFLQSSLHMKGKDIISSKSYEYNKNGELHRIVSANDELYIRLVSNELTGQTIINKTNKVTIYPDGRLKISSKDVTEGQGHPLLDRIYSKEGDIIEKTICSKDGNSYTTTEFAYDNNRKLIAQTIITNDNTTHISYYPGTNAKKVVSNIDMNRNECITYFDKEGNIIYENIANGERITPNVYTLSGLTSEQSDGTKWLHLKDKGVSLTIGDSKSIVSNHPVKSKCYDMKINNEKFKGRINYDVKTNTTRIYDSNDTNITESLDKKSFEKAVSLFKEYFTEIKSKYKPLRAKQKEFLYAYSEVPAQIHNGRVDSNNTFLTKHW